LWVTVPLTLVLAVVVFVWGIDQKMWLPQDPVGPLKRDPMAAEDLLGLELLDTYENDGVDIGNWFTLGSTGFTQINRTFALPEVGWEEVIKQIAAYAEGNGWERIDPYDEGTDWETVFAEPRIDIEFERPHPHKTMGLEVGYDSRRPGDGVMVTLSWRDKETRQVTLSAWH
jgi:hypothetical protein